MTKLLFTTSATGGITTGMDGYKRLMKITEH